MEFKMPLFNRKSRPAGIYKISFDGKYFYIGSSINLRTRFICWKTRLRAGTNKNKKIRELVKSVDVIEFSILEIIEDKCELRTRESFYINKYWDDPLLLNYCPYGDTNRGIRWSENDLKNRKRSTYFAKPIAIFNKNGDFIKKFDFMVDAARYLNVNGNEIKSYLKGERSTVKGYAFKLIGRDGHYIEPISFISKRKPRKPAKIKKPNTPSKEVIKYSLGNIEVSRYSSISKAAKAMNTDKSNFKKMVNKSKRSYYKGFIWKYA